MHFNLLLQRCIREIRRSIESQEIQNHGVIFNSIFRGGRTIVQRDPLSLGYRNPIVFLRVLFEGVLLDVVLLFGEMLDVLGMGPMRVLVGELCGDVPLFVAGVGFGEIFRRPERVRVVAETALAAARVVVGAVGSKLRFQAPVAFEALG